MIRVVVVEDDHDLLDDVVFSLRDEGFEVAACSNGVALDRKLASSDFDVVVLDIGLPGEDGLSIARRLRATRPQLGIVMLTARTDARSRVKGMEDGADIYLGKPTDLRELSLVIHALVRRLSVGKPPDTMTLTLLATEQMLIKPSGEQIELTPNETLILSRLVRATGHRATRREIIEAFGESYLEYDERRLEALVSRLRRKFETHGLPAETIHALRGSGYALGVPIQERSGRARPDGNTLNG